MDATQVYRALVVGLLGAIALEIAMLPGELRPRGRVQPPEPRNELHVRREAIGAIDQAIGAMIGQPVRELEAITVDGKRVRMVFEGYSSEMPRLAQ